MRVPIPDDWNGQSWLCAQIEWPNSPQWIAIFFGLLSQATRGRLWDERSGSILDAQQVGWQIWDRNIPLTDCSGSPGPVPDGGTAGLIGSLMCFGDDDMPCIDISGLLKVENGVLYARDSCCQWIEIGNFQPGTSSPDYGDDPLNPDGDPGFTYSACGKADALISKLIAVATTAWDSRDDPPWQYNANLHADHPDLAGGAVDFTSAVLLAIQLDVLTTHEDVFDTQETDTLRAWLSEELADDAAGLTSSQYSDLLHKITAVHGGLNPLDPLGVMKGNFWAQVLLAIGEGDASNIAQLGAGNTTGNCEGPIQWPQIPTMYDWVHYYDFRSGLHGFTDGQGMWVTGLGLINTDVDWAERLGDVTKTPVATGGHMTFMAMKVNVWPVPAGFGGVGPAWFMVDADSYYDAGWVSSPNWITWSPPTPPLIDGDIVAADYQFDNTNPDPAGVSQWYLLLIAGTGTDPFPGDP